jgi:hypothetical protein
MSDEPAAKPAPSYPSLRSAMWLYCLVLLGTTLIVIPLAFHIDVVFLRMVSTLFATLGFTIIAIYLTHTRPGLILGPLPAPITLLISLLAGLAIWLPAVWIMFAVYTWLDNAVGLLPAPMLTTATLFAVLLQAAIIVPLAQGLLFWGYIQRAGERLGKAHGAVLAATLFALYGLVTSELGLGSIPGLLLVGLLAAFITYYTGSAWCGIAVLAGYGIAWPLLQKPFVDYLGPQLGNPLSIRWLLGVAISGFVAFILFQAIRVRAGEKPQPAGSARAPKGLWWLPLAISIALVVLGAYSELALRASTGRTAPQIVPLRPDVPPVVIPATAMKSR